MAPQIWPLIGCLPEHGFRNVTTSSQVMKKTYMLQISRLSAKADFHFPPDAQDVDDLLGVADSVPDISKMPTFPYGQQAPSFNSQSGGHASGSAFTYQIIRTAACLASVFSSTKTSSINSTSCPSFWCETFEILPHTKGSSARSCRIYR